MNKFQIETAKDGAKIVVGTKRHILKKQKTEQRTSKQKSFMEVQEKMRAQMGGSQMAKKTEIKMTEEEKYFLMKDSPYHNKKRDFDFSKSEDVNEFLDLIAENNKYLIERKESFKREHALIASEEKSNNPPKKDPEFGAK